MSTIPNRKFNKSLSKTLTLTFIITILLTIVSLSSILFIQSKNMLISTLGNKALDIAKITAEKVNIDEYKKFNTPQDMEKQAYKDLVKTLDHIREISDSKFIYIMKQNEKGEFIYVLESVDYDTVDYDSNDPTLIGEVEETYDGFPIAMSGEPYIENDISVDQYGALITSYYPLKDNTGTVIGFIGVDYEVAQAHKSFKNLEKNILILSIALCILIMILGYFISKNISRPIKEAAIISEKIANYDLDTYHINIKNKDEIGLLANSINTMIDNLKDIVNNVQNDSATLKENIHNLNLMTTESTISVESITSSINEIALGSENTSTNIVELNNVISSFSNAMQETVANTEETNQVSNIMKESAYKGQEAVSNIIDKINLIYESTNTTSKVIEDLNNKVENINEIVQVINNISEQTNLLALNANIEAARAGDAGKGFAVVAEEVRKLAEETKTYSSEITSVISSIINNTKDAVNSISGMKSIVEESTNAANISNEVFKDLLEKINKTSILVNNISNASHEQASNTDNILQMISEVSSISEETTSTCQNSVASAEETLSSIEEITALTDNLEEIAASLNDLVSKFDL